jgi:hypothetical protein
MKSFHDPQLNVVAHGIDMVDCARLAEAIERHGERFMERVFTVPRPKARNRAPCRAFRRQGGGAESAGHGLAERHLLDGY